MRIVPCGCRNRSGHELELVGPANRKLSGQARIQQRDPLIAAAIPAHDLPALRAKTRIFFDDVIEECRYPPGSVSVISAALFGTYTRSLPPNEFLLPLALASPLTR